MPSASVFLELSDGQVIGPRQVRFELSADWTIRADEPFRWRNDTGRTVRLAALIAVTPMGNHRFDVASDEVRPRATLTVGGMHFTVTLDEPADIDALRALYLATGMSTEEYMRRVEAL